MKKNYNYLKFSVKNLLLLCFLLFTTVMPFEKTIANQRTINGSIRLQMERKVTINLKGVTLERVLEEIKKQTNINFGYESSGINKNEIFSITVVNVSVESALNTLLKSSHYSYVLKDNMIVITKSKTGQSASTQKITIKGKVMDESKSPISGATIIILGSSKGAITDENGVFSIQADGIVEIEISYMGFKNVTRRIAKSENNLLITLMEESIALNDVVVTGYQTLSRERSSGSFAVVSESAIRERANANGNLIQSLEGQATGFSVNITSDGKEEYLMRGLTSINSSTAPLFVVDGVAVSQQVINNMVNNNDVQSVTFLKDATAVSIWGSRAANGVVVITTKKGSDTAKKVKVSYEGSYTYKGMPDYDYQDMMSSETFIKNVREVFNPKDITWASIIGEKIPYVYPHEQLLYDYDRGLITEKEMNDGLGKLASQNNRKQYEDYFMQDAYLTRHNLALSGGTSTYKFYGSLGFENNASNSKNTTNKYMINLNQDFKFTPWLKFDLGVNIGLTTEKNNVSPSRSTGLPYMMYADESGNPLSHADLIYTKEFRESKEELGNLNLDFVPLEDTKNSFNKNKAINARVNAGLNIKLLKGLSYDGRFYYQTGSGKGEDFRDRTSWSVRDELSKFTQPKASPTALPTYYLPVSGGNFALTNSQSTEWTVRNQLSFDKKLKGDLHQITAMVGAELRMSKNNRTVSKLKGYDPQTLQAQPYDEKMLAVTGIKNPLILISAREPNYLINNPSYQSSEVELRYVSFYANGGYTFDGRYSINASVRIDQSNLFGSDKSVQYKPIWSVGAVWNITNEQFMKNAELFNRLALRFSYGLTGNSPDPDKGGPYNVIRTKVIGNAIYNDIGQGYEIEYPANAQLSWEKTRTWNFGIDFSMFENRFGSSIDIYNKYTTDLLGDLDLMATAGWSATFANTGIMTNKGIELALNSLNIANKNFRWSTNLTVSYNKNKINELYDMNNKSVSVLKDFVEGYPAYALWAWRYAGLDDMGDPMCYDPNGEKVKLANQADQNPRLGDNNSVSYMGVTKPVVYGGLTNTLRYRNCELSFLFIYNLGHKMRSPYASTSGRMSRNLANDFDKRWRTPGDKTDIPSYLSTIDAEARRSVEFYYRGDHQVLNASYIKLRDLSVAYYLPRRLCNKLASESIKVRFQASNLFTITSNDKGIDPEAHSLRSGSRLAKMMPTYSVSLAVNFK